MTDREKAFILEQIEMDYQELMENKGLHIDDKNKVLSYLMSQLEDKFNIPMLTKFLTEEQKASPELELYIKIANSRNYEDDYYNE